MNWSGVSFTPDGAPIVNFTGITNVSYDAGGSLAKFSGDGDRYNTTIVNDFNEPTFQVEGADLGAIRSVPVGTLGTFVATHNDAKNGAGAGAITYTLRAVVGDEKIGGAHRQFGKGSISFVGFSGDGQTNPLSTAVAA
jgi:hypothetical protein